MECEKPDSQIQRRDWQLSAGWGGGAVGDAGSGSEVRPPTCRMGRPGSATLSGRAAVDAAVSCASKLLRAQTLRVLATGEHAPREAMDAN